MINKLSKRHSYESLDNFKKYTIQCPCCGIILNFGNEDVYRDEEYCVHHDYIDCPECAEKIQLSDDDYFGY